MAVLLQTGVQYFNAVGEVLSGGFIHFYSAGTLVDKAIYTTELGNVQLANPIVLSAEGRIPSGGAWLLGNYRIRITDSAGVVINDIDNYHAYNLVDFSTLTATIAEINAVAGSLGTPGTVVASKAIVVDASKDISTFGVLSAATLRANTAIRTPQINDNNNVAAVTISQVPAQVNSITITPAITGSDPSILATGADSNIDLIIDGKGTGGVNIAGLQYPVADGTASQVITTNGSGTLSFQSIPLSSQIVKQILSATYTTYSSTTAVIPFDDTIPQITEGTEILTATITPTSSTSTLYVTVSGGLAGSGIINSTTAIFRDATANAIAASGLIISNSAYMSECSGSVVSGSTSATTFRVRVGTDTGTVYLNGISTGRKYGGAQAWTLRIMEV